MKFVERFKSFLQDHVNLNQGRIDQLDDRVEAITGYLKSGDHEIADAFVQTIPQGSYAQRTIIKPVDENDEFDADVLLELDEVSDWEAEDYVQKAYEAFRASSTYRGMVRRRTRCVVVDYANEFHVDVVPYLRRHGEQYITNRNENRFELTSPEGFNEWLEEQDRVAKRRLVKVIRLLKYLRDYKSTFSVKSVILTILVGERVNDVELINDPSHYADVPTALKNILASLNDYLHANPTMPLIADPSCPTESFDHRWNQDQYANFRDRIAYYSGKVSEAYDEPNREASLALWREIFGDEFAEASETRASKEQAHISRARDTEQFLERDLRIQTRINPSYKFKIDGRVAPRDGFRTYALGRHGNKVGKRRSITLSITKSTVPYPYDIYWKVRNFGEEAIQANAIRGQILKDGGERSRSETTLYKGNHYVECYAVKDGVCVAMDRQRVIIT